MKKIKAFYITEKIVEVFFFDRRLHDDNSEFDIWGLALITSLLIS